MIPGINYIETSFIPRTYWTLWNTLTSRHPLGTNIFERDWDVLIVLDTCRVDALRKMKKEFDFIKSVDRILSVGSQSAEWMLNTFTNDYKKEIKDTVLVSGNIWSYRILRERLHEHTDQSAHPYLNCSKYADWDVVREDDFLHVDQSWQLKDTYGSLHQEGYAAPHIFTDRAIHLGRRYDFDRPIVHYSLPHLPYIAMALAEDRSLYDYEKDFKPSLKKDTSLQKVRESYHENLRLVLKYVERLLHNIEADDVVITADHGEAFGEWGFYKHPFGLPHPSTKVVPWCETTAVDNNTYETRYPSPQPNALTESDKQEHLRDLGYLS
jgi:hypothetical protein